MAVDLVPLAVFPFPKHTALFPLAVLPSPPPIKECVPLAVLSSPAIIPELAPLATCVAALLSVQRSTEFSPLAFPSVAPSLVASISYVWSVH